MSDMIVKTRIFELCNERYRNLSELARSMEISISQIYRVREGKRSINQKFIVGAIRAFPDRGLEELFYLVHDSGDGRSVKERGGEFKLDLRGQYLLSNPGE